MPICLNTRKKKREVFRRENMSQNRIHISFITNYICCVYFNYPVQTQHPTNFKKKKVLKHEQSHRKCKNIHIKYNCRHFVLTE